MIDFILLAQQQAEGPPIWSFLPLWALIGLAFYFVMIRPSQRDAAARRVAVQAMKKNDRIITAGGIIGIVDSIKENENEVLLKGGLRVTKTSIVEVYPEGEKDKE